MKAKNILIATISFLIFPALCFSGSVTYYNADGVEISAEAYQELSRKNVERYNEAVKHGDGMKTEPGRVGKKTDPVLQIIEISGMNQFIDAFPGMIDAQIAQRKMTTGVPEIEQKIAKLLKTSFDPEAARRNLYEFLKNKLDEKTLRDTLAWLETPVAMKIARAEHESISVEAQAETLRYIAGFQNNPPPPARVAVIQRLVKEAKLVESTVALVIDIMTGMISSFNLVMPDAKKVSKRDIQAQINSMKPMLEQAIRQQVTMSTFYTYRNISNADLEKYINHLTSESGSKFNDIGIKAISYTLIQFFDGIAGDLVSSFKV